MKRFIKLYNQLDQTTKTNDKVAALQSYFAEAKGKDRLWTIALFSHRRPKRTVNTTMLREWAAETADIPSWLFEESYHVVGDLAETIALILPKAEYSDEKSLTEWIHLIKSLSKKEEAEKKEAVLKAWKSLSKEGRFLFNKLLTGGFRVGVSKKLVIKALSRFLAKDENVIAHRLMGGWTPDTHTFEELLESESEADVISKPYPFYLAYALEGAVHEIGNPEEWSAEHKWDGIRGQLIKRKGKLFVWSRGEELVTDKYPEFDVVKNCTIDRFVLDGEILPFKERRPLNFQELQTRIGRKQVSKKMLEKTPVVFMCYDLLEIEGKDIRKLPYRIRRKKLRALIQNLNIQETILLSEEVPFAAWDELVLKREKSREYGTEGFMLKKKNSEYKTGRKKGEWWKWKVDPMTIDAVMIYAMRGHGRRTNLYTDFTFAVWRGDELVPFAKAYSGLTDAEFSEITRYVQRNTIDRFGPVRAVKPNLVFEIAFEGINESKRHKSGIAVRFPRIKRWRKDKHPKEADTLDNLKTLINQQK